MSDINVQLVREFFELHLFRVLTNWEQAPSLAGERAAQLFVENTALPPHDMTIPADGILGIDELPLVERAVVEIRAWHGDRFYVSIIESNPDLFDFARKDASSVATECFGNQPFKTLLVVSELPASRESRDRALQLLRGHGVDFVIEFPTVLQGILGKIHENSSYTGSPTLQTIRLLKRYRFLRHSQMEFEFVSEPPPPIQPVRVDTTVLHEDEQEEMFT